MKKVVFFIFFVTVVLAWLYSGRLTESEKANINQVTFQPSSQDPAPKVQEQHAVVKSLAVEARIKAQTIKANHQPESLVERSYMAIYRDLKLAEDCSYFYRKHHEVKGQYNHLQPLHEAYQYQFQTGQEAPRNQVQALETWIQQCLNLKSAVFFRASIDEEFPDYTYAYPVLVELRKEWYSTQPQTPAEKHLAKITLGSEQWRRAMNQLRQISKGDYFYNKQERDSLQGSVTQIEQQLDAIYQQTDQADWVEIEKLSQQMIALNEQMDQRLPVDEVIRLAALDEFNQLTYMMEQAMYDGFPASFVALVESMEMIGRFSLKVAGSDYHSYKDEIKKLIPEYTPPSQHLFAYAKTQDHQVFNLMVEPASHLLLCYLGADCGPESEWVRYYCLGNSFHEKTYPGACGKSLLDFYTEEYLSPNQWHDVSILFDMMVGYYES